MTASGPPASSGTAGKTPVETPVEISVRPSVRKWLKTGALGIAAVLVILVLGFALGEATGWTPLRAPLQRQLEQQLQVPVRLEDGFTLRLLPPARLLVGSLHIGAGGGLSDNPATPHLLQARDVELGWTWRDAWRGWRGQGWRLNSLQAAELDARLLRDAQGRASWQLGPPAATPGNEAGAKPPAESPMDLPRVGRIEVGAGRIAWADALTDTDLLAEIQGAEGASTSGGASRGDAAIAAAASGAAAAASSASGTTAAGATANGNVAPGYRATLNGRWRALPLRLRLQTGGLLPLVLDGEDEGRSTAAADARLFVEGQAGAARLRFDGRAGALLGARRLDGDLLFAGPSLARVGTPLRLTLPQTLPFELRGRLAHDGGVWKLSAVNATVGGSRLGGDYVYDSRPSPGRLSGRLLGTRLALADLGPAIGSDGKPGERDASGRRDRVLPQREFDLPSLRAMDADLTVAIDELLFGSAGVEPWREVRAKLLLQAGVLRLDGLQAKAAGGRFTANSSLDGNVAPARWTLDLGFERIDLASWISGLRKADAPPPPRSAAAQSGERRAARRSDAPPRAWITGLLSGQAQVQGQGRSTAQILGTLNGRARASLRDGSFSHLATELAGLDIAQALGVALRGDRPLLLRCANLDLVLQQGIARPRLAVLDDGDSVIRVAGQISLRDETLDLKATVRPRDFSPLSLRTPITVTGTLGEPKLGIDGGKLAGKVLGAAALGAIAGPLAALLPLIDRGENPADPCAVAPVTAPDAGGPRPKADAAASKPKPEAAALKPKEGATTSKPLKTQPVPPGQVR